VSSPHGTSHHYADHVESGNFAFTGSESGDYTACFWIPDSRMSPSTVTIEFDWRSGIAAKDWSKVAKKGQIEPIPIMDIDDVVSRMGNLLHM
ncbi:transmembrane emp24 domain-containing protein p24delta7-like, partial [Trifolium medium]|nr:transmembrane emp24 domain-containing protein p24delta7-like [Trifolium medium]